MHFTLRRVELWIRHCWTTFWWCSVLSDRGQPETTMTKKKTKMKTTRFRPTLLCSIPLGQSSFRWQLWCDPIYRKLLLIAYCNHWTKPSQWPLITMRIRRFYHVYCIGYQELSVIWRRRWECIEGAHSHGIIWSKLKDFTILLGESNLDEKSRLDFENLFSRQHLQRVQHVNFGKTGSQISSKHGHPLWNKLQEHMVSTTGSDFSIFLLFVVTFIYNVNKKLEG